MWPGIPDTYQNLPQSDSGSFRYTRSRDYQSPTRHTLLGSGRSWKTNLNSLPFGCSASNMAKLTDSWYSCSYSLFTRKMLSEPTVTTITGSRGFSYTAPSIWNEIPLNICNNIPLASFNRYLKTHYFVVPSHSPIMSSSPIPQWLPVPQLWPSWYRSNYGKVQENSVHVVSVYTALYCTDNQLEQDQDIILKVTDDNDNRMLLIIITLVNTISITVKVRQPSCYLLISIVSWLHEKVCNNSQTFSLNS